MIKKLSPPVKTAVDGLDQRPPPALAPVLFETDRLTILDPTLSRQLIRQRQQLGIDGYDEVWDGVYIVPPLANNPHQRLVTDLVVILFDTVVREVGAVVQPGANVSDRRDGWEHSFRVPDVVVVLKQSEAIDCGSHWFGGPDFLVEIQSPGDDTEEKILFYSRIRVRELVVIQRDTRRVRFYRHDGTELVLDGQSDRADRRWLESQVIPLAFRWKSARSGPCTELKRLDKKRQSWTV